MKTATKRKVNRWFYVLASMPVLGSIYDSVATLPEPAFAVKFIILPTVVVSGFWLWLGHHVRKWWRSTTPLHTARGHVH